VSVSANAVTARLRAYDPGHDLPALRARRAPELLAELGSNENAWGPSPRVAAALAAADPAEIYRYPDPRGGRLKHALAERFALTPFQIALGNGSHELLMLIAQCFAAPGDEVLFSEFGFAVFAIGTAAVGATPVVAPALTQSSAMPRGHDLAALAARITARTRIVFVANPNNPTGTWFSRAELKGLMAKAPADVLVVVDEAYHEFVDDPAVGSALELCAEHPNLLVTRTFSKAYGLAGLRVGYALGDTAVIAVVERLRESFNVNALALLAAEAALADPDHVAHVLELARAERARMQKGIETRGWFVHPSMTNFLLVDFARPAVAMESRLLDAGVVVRPMGGYGLPTCLRISIGREQENDRFLAALAEARTQVVA
jgi:histidinol-phosphate aminotransferase